MFCKKCGNQLNESDSFCKYCGTSQSLSPSQSIITKENNNLPCEDPSTAESIIYSKEHDNSSAYKTLKDNIHLAPSTEMDIFNNNEYVEVPPLCEHEDAIKKLKIFHSDDEVLIGILDSGFISSLFVQKSFSKSVLFCSNKRVYQKGMLFERNLPGKIFFYNGEKSVNIKDITGIGYYVEHPIYKIIFISILIFAGIMLFIAGSNNSGDERAIIWLFSFIFILFGIIMSFIYSLKKGKWILLEYDGGTIISNCNWYSKKSIENFIKILSNQRDKILNYYDESFTR